MKHTGKVLWFSKHLGFGFIKIENDPFPDAFFHYSDIKTEGYKTIKRGQKVEFELHFTRKGPVACDVCLVDVNAVVVR